MSVLLKRAVHVDYSQIYVLSDPTDDVVPGDPFNGQTNGICGAATPGGLFLVTGLQDGSVGFTVELHDRRPKLGSKWGDVVEVSFAASGEGVALKEWCGSRYPLDLPQGAYRVRYCACDMDEGKLEGTLVEDISPDEYLLQFWPAPVADDRIVRQTSEVAKSWHRGRVEKSPSRWSISRKPSSEDDARRRAELAKLDSELVTVLVKSKVQLQRRVAGWAAMHALTKAGMVDLPPLMPALDCLRQGKPTPKPFSNELKAMELLVDAVPRSTVKRIVTGTDNDKRRVSRQAYAISALAAAGQRNATRAAIETIYAAAIVYGPEYVTLFARLRAEFPEL
ncbi:hypothetical protein ACIBSW_10945 [Actinoplanes sp. NPDC049668]|uniref:hypothetical protein n=1 Tax=unclassified Actinoplanes TaxID=2626549 RepID=UPI0033B36AE0